MSFGVSGEHMSSTDIVTSLLNSLQTTQQQQQQQSSGTGTTASSTQRNLSPYQQNIQAPVYKTISDLMTNPQKFVAPAQNQAREQVNQNYAGSADALRSQFMQSGGGSSGKFGTALVQSDLARRGQLSQVDNAAAAQAAQLPITGAQLGEALLGQDFGQTTTGTTSTAANTTTSGTSQTQGTQTGTQTDNRTASDVKGGIGFKLFPFGS